LAIKKIVVKFLDELKSSLEDKKIRLTLTESVIDLLADKGYDNKMGARPLGRKIDELIRVPLSRRILFDRLSNCTIQAVRIDDRIDFIIDTALLPGVNEQGYIVLDQPSPEV
jgi:ATP-dependent Clp protease ATP-binding subunit ClpA